MGKRLGWWWVSTCLAVASCYGGDDTVSLEEFPDAYASAVCDRVLECSLLGLVFYPVGCEENVAYALRNGQVPALQDAIEAGTIIYDAEAMRRCMDALASGPCADLGFYLLTDVEACADALIGQVPLDGACVMHEECERGLYCEGDAACPGACTPRALAGENCLGTRCAAGLACTTGDICTARVGAGDDCSTRSCEYGLECRSSDDTCVEVPRTAGEGEPCLGAALTEMCAGTLACTAETVDAYICRAQVDVGEACYFALPDQCIGEVYCSAQDSGVEGVCVAPAQLGQSCIDIDFQEVPCEVGLVCDPGGVCQPRRDNGEVCSSDEQCVGTCDGTCTTPVPCP